MPHAVGVEQQAWSSCGIKNPSHRAVDPLPDRGSGGGRISSKHQIQQEIHLVIKSKSQSRGVAAAGSAPATQGRKELLLHANSSWAIHCCHWTGQIVARESCAADPCATAPS